MQEKQDQVPQKSETDNQRKLTEKELEQVNGGYAKKDYSDDLLMNGKGSRIILSKERMYNEHVEE